MPMLAVIDIRKPYAHMGRLLRSITQETVYPALHACIRLYSTDHILNRKRV
jgi:hypothetical protein